ncbi:MAG: carbamoyltransferase [Acidobacteriia bacterium]|nr:carbamoyltransferase [Terriglobia bacterium]
MYVLGINAYHGDTSASLIKDGDLVAAVEQERFNRIKYTSAFPVDAIRYCLEMAGIEPRDLEYVAIGRDPWPSMYKKIMYMLSERPDFGMAKDSLARTARIANLQRVMATALNIEPDELTAKLHRVEHHVAHCASAFLVSGYDEAAIMSIDGFGDFVSMMLAVGRGTKIEPLARVWFPHSIGLFYTAITQYCGFTKYGDEGKFMGLAPFGKPTYVDDMREMARLKPEGQFELNLNYFVHQAQNVYMNWESDLPEQGIVYSQKLVQRFGPPREPRTEITEHYANMAASAQVILEEVYFHALDYLYGRTGLSRLCLAGGVALNSVANGKVLLRTPFRDIFIQPAAGDAGLSLGAAFYVYHSILGQARCFEMIHTYTGPEHTSAEIKSALDKYRLRYQEFADDEICKRTAELMTEKKVVGWFQGRMEFGPRALGNRSIVVDSRWPDMKDILNSRVKNRESFRPFAPSVLEEAAGEWFEQSYPDPFMLKVYRVKDEKRGIIPAVTHVDGTGRLQTVSQKSNPQYWRLIKEFERLTGVPVILNTSFNENEPIVCTPTQAIECFLRTRMDYLVLGDHLVSKTENARGESGG